MPLASLTPRFLLSRCAAPPAAGLPLALSLALVLAPPPAAAHSAQPHQAQTPHTHHYDLRDAALARVAQRYDWAQEGKGDRAVLEELVANDYTLVRGSGKTTDKAGLIALICSPTGYTNPYVVEAPIVKDMGDTVILGGFVRITGTDGGKSFAQKARFADIWHKDPTGWRLHFTQVTLADHP